MSNEAKRFAELLKIDVQDAREFGEQIQAKLSSRSIDLNDVVLLLETHINSLPSGAPNIDELIQMAFGGEMFNSSISCATPLWFCYI
jgi:hypothetical protein